MTNHADKTERQYLDKVLKAPSDDRPRSRYADWLLDRGDARGEFIHLQLASGRTLKSVTGIDWTLYVARWIERVEPPSNDDRQVEKEDQLYKKHIRSWIAPVRKLVRNWWWKGGFIYSVDAGPALLEQPDTLFSLHPVQRLDLSGLKPRDVARLADLPVPRSLKILRLVRQRITPELLGPLLASPLLGIEFLDLSANPLGREGAELIARARNLKALRSLAVTGIDADGIMAIATSKTLVNLEELRFVDNYNHEQFPEEGLLKLARDCTLPKLVHIHLGCVGAFSPKVRTALMSRFPRSDLRWPREK